jgi:hypothetical protein
MAVNKYAAPCGTCGHRVPPNGGTVRRVGRRWVTEHLACEGGTPAVIATTFNSGATVYQNARGRCEDAPCCGCCS